MPHKLRVRCRSLTMYPSWGPPITADLTVGKKYEVLDDTHLSGGEHYRIIDDLNHEGLYPDYIFEPVSDDSLLENSHHEIGGEG
ncbi:hypothetical protein HY967_01665 [Candidatus Jorgensenbacteria bacterium]|nr:hypothetical protein [Candidatus Jorgensenbacteria bacterium]